MAQEVQSLVFSKNSSPADVNSGNGWTVATAKRWAADHRFRNDKVDEPESGETIRLRQFDPGQCARDTYEVLTRNFPKGVQAVACKRKSAGADEPDEATTAEGALQTEDALVCEEAKVLNIDAEHRRVTHVISTARLDRGNRIVDVGGWKLGNFRKAPRVLADHRYTIDNVIGRALDTKVEGEALVSTTEFDTDGLGAVAFRLVQNGMVNTWSVGWVGLKRHRIGSVEDCEACNAVKDKIEWGLHFTQQELLEYSLVAVPANPEAVMGLEAAGLVSHDAAEIWLEAFTTPARSPAFDQALGEFNRDMQRAVAARRVSRELKRIR